jgi:AcrR family transcriptional regulator
MTKRPSLTRESIVATAIILADKGGLAALSMRKLAKELDVQAMSLYYHFKTKDELIVQMTDLLIGQIDTAISAHDSASDWRAILTSRAIAAKSVFQKHPWLPFVLDTQVQSGRKRLEYNDTYIGTLRKAGFPIELSLKVISLVDSYLYGFCRQLSHLTDSEESFEEQAGKFSAAFDAAEYPYLNEATTLVMNNGYDEHADFLFGLRLILNGVHSELVSLENK